MADFSEEHEVIYHFTGYRDIETDSELERSFKIIKKFATETP